MKSSQVQLAAVTYGDGDFEVTIGKLENHAKSEMIGVMVDVRFRPLRDTSLAAGVIHEYCRGLGASLRLHGIELLPLEVDFASFRLGRRYSEMHRALQLAELYDFFTSRRRTDAGR